MKPVRPFTSLALGVLVATIVACSSPGPPPAATSAPAAVPPSPAAGQDQPEAPSPFDALPEAVRAQLDKPFTGDLDQMVQRRVVRAGVVFNRTQYFIDRGEQRGMAYESFLLFEEYLNHRFETGRLKVHVVCVPLARDQLFPALSAGKVDVIAAMLTVTPERRKLATFTNPTRSNVSEIVVTDSDAAPITTLDDLSGREIFVRRSSSYYESLRDLNRTFAARGLTPVSIREAPEPLEDDDILEMVNAGLVDVTVVDDYVADFWRQVFPDIRPHPGVALRTGGTLAAAVRPGNPGLLEAANDWIRRYGPRTTFGNVVARRYLQNASYLRRAADEAEPKEFETLVGLFRKYGEQYQVDPVLMAAQGYQESRLDQSVRSRSGAIGVMQVMPATGRDLGVGDISQVEPNIHAGVKYFRFMMDRYFANEPMDDLNKGLMTLASYNAGPGRIRRLRREAADRGLNPNVWFGNVERVVSEKVGRETVQYVSNVYKYYVAYTLTLERQAAKRGAKSAGR